MHFALLALLLVGSCVRSPAGPDRATALAAMDTALATGRRAHLETNAELLAAGIADTLVSVADGAVTLQPKDSVRAVFQHYFAGASYRFWDDIEPPRIQLSDDNTMAWVSRVVCVDREEPAPEGGRRRRLFRELTVAGGAPPASLHADRPWRDAGMTTA